MKNECYGKERLAMRMFGVLMLAVALGLWSPSQTPAGALTGGCDERKEECDPSEGCDLGLFGTSCGDEVSDPGSNDPGSGGSGGGDDGPGQATGDGPAGSAAPVEVCRVSEVYPPLELRANNNYWAFATVDCTPTGRTFPRVYVCVIPCPTVPTPPTDAENDPVLNPTVIRDRVYASVVPVPPPAVVSPDAPVVGVPAFLQVDGFAERSASDVEGGLTVEVVATPIEVRWVFGDSERVCSTGGAGFTPERLDAAMAAAVGLIDDGVICTFLFTTSSEKDFGGPTSASVTTVWDYSWSLNGVDQGVFNAGVVSPSNDFPVTVREYQAVLTG